MGFFLFLCLCFMRNSNFAHKFHNFVWKHTVAIVFNLCAYIIATADGHAGMARCDLSSLAGSRQVIIKPTAGIITGDRREFIQRQIHVLQTAKHTKRQITSVTLHINRYTHDIYIQKVAVLLTSDLRSVCCCMNRVQSLEVAG